MCSGRNQGTNLLQVCKQSLPQLLITASIFFVDLENHQGQPACVELEITELL